MPDDDSLVPAPAAPSSSSPSEVTTRRTRRGVSSAVATAVGGVIGGAIGLPAGMIAAHVADGSSPLPLRTFDWILEHGVQGVLVTIVFVLGWVLFRGFRERAATEREWRESERAWMKERSTLEREYRVKVEALIREQVPIAERTRRALEQNTMVLRSLHLLEEDAEGGV